jgi:hypothetical protein
MLLLWAAAHEVLALEKEARDAVAAGRLDRAVTAATDAKLALDSDLLNNVNFMVGIADAPLTSPPSASSGVVWGVQDHTKQEFDHFLPCLRLEVDKALRRLCASDFNAAQYHWMLKSYLVSPCASIFLVF